jgi:hypothetical protein
VTEAFLAAAGYWSDSRRRNRLIDMRISQAEGGAFKTMMDSLKD